jgi:hypothetical protein
MIIISLTTDFGLADGYVGMMKGVILGIAPRARLVDLTHSIEPQNVRQAAYVLAHASPFFPRGTIHVGVVDPGVGSSRRPLLITTEHACYLGPDNGLFSEALGRTDARAWELDQPRFWLPQISRTFHGRDIFAPVAAHLASGVLPEQLGHPIDDALRFDWTEPQHHDDGHLSGTIVYIDGFGNLISDIPAAWMSRGRWRCQLAGHPVPVANAYADVAVGALVALAGSSGALEVAMRNGNAARRLAVTVGTALELWPLE